MAKIPEGNGFVYFIAHPTSGQIKIGWSRNPMARCRALSGASGVSLQMLAVIPGDRQLERDLHRKFKACRRVGEWFEDNHALRSYIAGSVSLLELDEAQAAREERRSETLSNWVARYAAAYPDEERKAWITRRLTRWFMRL